MELLFPPLITLESVWDSQPPNPRPPMAGETLGAPIPKNTCVRGVARRGERPYRCAGRRVHICVCETRPSSHATGVSGRSSLSYLVPKPLKALLLGNCPGAAYMQGLLGKKSPRKENEGLRNEGHPPAGSEMRRSGAVAASSEAVGESARSCFC